MAISLNTSYMKTLNIIIAACLLASLSSCYESLEERAQREAREYTEKYCPTPPDHSVITDSLVFDPATRTQKYYLTFTGLIDDAEALAEHAPEIKTELLESIRGNTSMKPYKEAGFNFEYVCRSQKNPSQVLIHVVYRPKDYASPK